MGTVASKVLQRVSGVPMVERVIAQARQLAPARITVVTSPSHPEVRRALWGRGLRFALQQRPRGTADATLAGCGGIPAKAVLLVLFGDLPLITAGSLRRLVAQARRGKLAVRTMRAGDPRGYSRILRDAAGRACDLVVPGQLRGAQRAIDEVDAGGMAMIAGWGIPQMRAIRPIKGESYLTALVARAHGEGVGVATVEVSAAEGLGVNTPAQLLHAESCLSTMQVAKLQEKGVLFAEPGSVQIKGELAAAAGAFIDRNVQFAGRVSLGRDVTIGANCLLKDARLEAGAKVEAFTLVEGAILRSGASAGPFARLRPGTILGRNAKVGNFVETKNSRLEEGAKASHLSYLGDGRIGARVNVGAGTVLCNYDGRNKHQVTIGANAFVGSGSMLVAPLAIGANSLIAAGSVVTKDVPAGSKVFGRARQLTRTKPAAAARGKRRRARRS